MTQNHTLLPDCNEYLNLSKNSSESLNINLSNLSTINGHISVYQNMASINLNMENLEEIKEYIKINVNETGLINLILTNLHKVDNSIIINNNAFYLNMDFQNLNIINSYLYIYENEKLETLIMNEVEFVKEAIYFAQNSKLEKTEFYKLDNLYDICS